MHPERDPEFLEWDSLVKREVELRHHAARFDVFLSADADEAPSAKCSEAVLDSSSAALGRQAEARMGGVDQPAELGVVGPRAVVGEPDPADQLTGREQLGRPDPEAVLLPVPAVALERCCGLLQRHRPLAHVAHHDGIGVPASERREILVAPAAELQPRGFELHYSSCLRKTTQALCPPKPNEFETPTVISDFRAAFGM